MDTHKVIPLPLAPVISDFYRDPALLGSLHGEFSKTGFVKLPNFLDDSTFELIARNLNDIYENRVRRDFIMPGFHTERKMSVVGGAKLARQCLAIVALYGNVELRNVISKITGDQVFTVRHEEEFMVANFLDGQSDTHGWHTDDPEYALIVITEFSGALGGGELEYIPRWNNVCSELGLNPMTDSEKGVAFARSIGSVRTEKLNSGECYLLNANEALHRVTPMIGNGRRKALNMAFDNRHYRKFGESAQILYGANNVNGFS
jgi:hypothetical protein